MGRVNTCKGWKATDRRIVPPAVFDQQREAAAYRALRKDAAPANAAAPAPPSSSSSARVAVDVEAPPPTRSPPPVVEAYRSSPRPAAVVLRSAAGRAPAAIGARPAKKRRSFSLKTTLLVAYVLALHSLVFFSFSHCHDIETYLDLEEAA